MKFNQIVGNPPYQINDGSGASTDASNPIYQIFLQLCKKINTDSFSLIIPAKWLVGGKSVLKKFTNEMIKDNCFKYFFDYEDSKVCFDNMNIDGGICYFLWDNNYNNKELNYIYQLYNGVIIKNKRLLGNPYNDLIVRDNRRLSIIQKTNNEKNLSDIISASKPFGIRKDLFNSPNRYPTSNLQFETFENSVKIFGVKGFKGGAKRIIGFIDKSIINKNINNIDKHKLFFTTSYSTNAPNPPETIIGDPNSICTETFLVIGSFDTKIEQMNCYKYIKTDFFKVLLFFGKGTMQVTQKVFGYIPLQNFTEKSDIKWNETIEEINIQLYKKYNINEIEINLINTILKKRI